MNVTSILLKKIILEADSETWVRIRKHYLPAEYHTVFTVVNKLFEEVGSLPSFDALKLSVRSDAVLNKVYAIEAAETVEIDNSQLLEFVKNEYTQEEIMEQITKYLEESIMMGSAKENVDKLQDIIFHIEDRVDLKDPDQDMQRMPLFASDEDLAQRFALGLNAEYDAQIKYAPGEYILIGGVRGTGKSLTCANIAVNAYNQNRSSIYFTIEMTSQAILQRMCAIATGVPARHLRNRNLSHGEWNTVAKWWSERFEGGKEAFNKYMEHHSFDDLHQDLIKSKLREDRQLDIVYDPSLTMGTIKSELDKKVERLNPSHIIVDYANQVKRNNNYKNGQYDWTEQIEVSKALKTIAQEYGLPVISPFQIDASGEARFSKGLLDSCDAAFNLDAHSKEDNCITFNCVKMRDEEEVSFSSNVDWPSLRIGPGTATPPSKDKKSKDADYGNEQADDM